MYYIKIDIDIEIIGNLNNDYLNMLSECGFKLFVNIYFTRYHLQMVFCILVWITFLSELLINII